MQTEVARFTRAAGPGTELGKEIGGVASAAGFGQAVTGESLRRYSRLPREASGTSFQSSELAGRKSLVLKMRHRSPGRAIDSTSATSSLGPWKYDTRMRCTPPASSVLPSAALAQ